MKRPDFSHRNFSGKLLLMGEHSVIDGSKAGFFEQGTFQFCFLAAGKYGSGAA
jgi:hypothetical protein